MRYDSLPSHAQSEPALIAGLRRVLAQPLPGINVQQKMAPHKRASAPPARDVPAGCRHAGTLLLLYPVKTDLTLVLTRRSDSLLHHRGQMSLPGGAVEHDEGIESAALREAWEELGIDRAKVEVLGKLTQLYLAPSGYCMHPVVAYTPHRPDFMPCCEEVAEVIEVSLSKLLQEETCSSEARQIDGATYIVPFYAVDPVHKVWGGTAMVLCEFLSIVRGMTEV